MRATDTIATAISLILLTGFAIGLDRVIKWLIRLYRSRKQPPQP